ncbi:MAG TPA: ArsC family reductase [Methylotenera sp.]|jgi:arsenate reductase
MKLYGIPNCNTVKKARDWLDANNIAYEFHDFKKQGIDEATINSWLSQYPWEKLINRAGLTWRGLDDAIKSSVTDNISATTLMQAKTSVIKRPILVKDGKIFALGFDENAYKETCLL